MLFRLQNNMYNLYNWSLAHWA